MTFDPRPRVLVDPGTFDLCNVGDVSMLQVAVRRAARAWPWATIDVLTDNPAALARHCPGTNAVPNAGRDAWMADVRAAFMRHGRRGAMTAPIAGAQQSVRQRWPRMYGGVMRYWARARGDVGAFDGFIHAVSSAALLLVAGQGTIADAGERQADALLATVGLLTAWRRPVALLGQGIGPLDDPVRRQRAAATLRQARLVALREGRRGPTLLSALEVPPNRVTVTGDDAIALVTERRTDRMGSALGVHVRWARLAVKDAALLAEVTRAIGSALRAHDAQAVGLPISRHRVGTDDARTIRALLAEVAPDADVGDDCSTPAELIGRAARCRVVVTGAYHAAVFALAQGIPVVCLGASEYYLDKFRGLQDLFGEGCGVVSLEGPELAERITSAVAERWDAAAHYRVVLRAAADRQHAAGEAAFARLAPLLGAPRLPLVHRTREPGVLR